MAAFLMKMAWKGIPYFPLELGNSSDRTIRYSICAYI